LKEQDVLTPELKKKVDSMQKGVGITEDSSQNFVYQAKIDVIGSRPLFYPVAYLLHH